MAKLMIDLEGAEAYVQANYQGDPLIRHMYEVLLDKLPKVEEVKPEPCHMCDNAFVNEELTRDEDLSYVGLGNFFLGYRAMLRSGDGKPVEIITEHWNCQNWEEVGRYRPAFCPNCGRELVENQQFKPLDPCGFRNFYSQELIHESTSDEAIQRLKEGI